MRLRPLLPLCLVAACSSDPSPAPSDAAVDAARDAVVDAPATPDYPYTEPPRSVLAEPGVRRDVELVTVPAAPANPSTRASTPETLNRVQVIRYRPDGAAGEPRAVVVAMPGFLGGAGSFDALARALVKRGTAASEPVEVWVIDRRSNLLEDLRGMDAADALNNPEVAARYYLSNDVTVGGRAFAGYLTATDPALSYMAEWGMATLVRDLRAVIDRVTDARHRVVLLGHSLGATIVEAYAAWDFDGTPGYRTLAGLAMVDGVAGGTEITEAQYLTAGVTAPGGFGSTNLATLRARGPYFTALPILGVQALVVSEITARRARLAPDAIVDDNARDGLFRVLLGLSEVPRMSNAAALGFAFDEASCPLGFARMSMGAPAGGALRMGANVFDPREMLTTPANGTDTFTWRDATAVTPAEFTSRIGAANAWALTPTNFGEWYFPSRLSLDASAVGTLRYGASSWQVREGLRVMHGGEIDVPVLGISAALVGSAEAYERVRMRVAPTIGSDLPAAGATRSDARAFQAVHMARMTHLDPLTGDDDDARNPVPARVFSFVRAATAGSATPRM